MGKTLAHRLDDACEFHGLEWLVLPFDRGGEPWRDGPYLGALVTAQDPRRRGRPARFYQYNEEAHIPEDRGPDPEVVYITLQASPAQPGSRLGSFLSEPPAVGRQRPGRGEGQPAAERNLSPPLGGVVTDVQSRGRDLAALPRCCGPLGCRLSGHG